MMRGRVNPAALRLAGQGVPQRTAQFRGFLEEFRAGLRVFETRGPHDVVRAV